MHNAGGPALLILVSDVLSLLKPNNNHMSILTSTTQLFESLSYTGLFLWLIVYNLLFFVPLPPPEIILLTVGYIASLGHIDPFIAGFLIVLTSGLSDNAFFLLALKGNKLVQKIIQKSGGQKILLRFKSRMEKNPLRTLILLAYIPSVRFFGPIISGTLKLNWKKFFVYDSFSNIIFSTTYISLGFFFHRTIRRFVGELTIWEHLLFYPIMIIIALIVTYLIRKQFLLKKGLAKS
jgi:membrane protein DedA with SNARE-associated domain